MQREMDRMLELADQLCAEAVRKGADFAEVETDRACGTTVELDGNTVKSAEICDSSAVVIQAYVAGGKGVAYVQGGDLRAARAAAARAVAMARAVTPDPDFRRIAENLPAPDVPGLYDEAVHSLSAATLSDWAAGLVDEAQSVADEALVFGVAQNDVEWGAFANSLGIRTTWRHTALELSASVLVRRGGETGSFYDFEEGRGLADVRPNGLGERVARQAVGFLGARKVRSANLPVVLAPLVGQELLHSVMAAAGADHVQRGRSYLADCLERKIASEALTVTDDATQPGGVESSARDAEGYPHAPLIVIDQGVLRAYLHNTYTALKRGVKSTGHAGPGSGTEATNLLVRPGARTAAEIIADTREGLYVSMGLLHPDVASSELSAMVDFGFKIEKGRLAYPVADTMVAGRTLEMLAGIDAVSSDYRAFPGNVLPTIRIARMQVTGSG